LFFLLILCQCCASPQMLQHFFSAVGSSACDSHGIFSTFVMLPCLTIIWPCIAPCPYQAVHGCEDQPHPKPPGKAAATKIFKESRAQPSREKTQETSFKKSQNFHGKCACRIGMITCLDPLQQRGSRKLKFQTQQTGNIKYYNNKTKLINTKI
jgi:hypothetical protein